MTQNHVSIGYEFRPRPIKDDLSICIRSGWRYVVDIEDSLETLNRKNGMTDSERSLFRAAELIRSGYPAAYVLGANIVYDVATDTAGNPMFLTRIQDVCLEQITKPLTDSERIL